MEFIYRISFIVCLSLNSSLLFSQITITEIQKSEIKIVSKPPTYDSLKNWEHHEQLSDYKKYIGLDIYLPPFPKAWKKSNSCIINKGGGYCDSTRVGNTYFTILDVLYGDKIDNWCWNIYYEKLSKNNSGLSKPRYIFLLKNNKTNDTLYSFYPIEGWGRGYIDSEFILVPYFVKQKKLYENQVLIYDDKWGSFWGNYVNKNMKVFDERFIIKSENNNGIERKTYKEVIVEPDSKWSCSEVTLLKRTNGYMNYTFKIYYILKNEKGEQITVTNIDGLINEKDYLKRKTDKNLEEQEILAKEKHEEQLRVEAEKNANENYKTECVNFFGKENAELIIQGKLKIGMSKEMCQYSWGKPFWTSKRTTEYGSSEVWYYGLGYSLHFENDLLKVINE